MAKQSTDTPSSQPLYGPSGTYNKRTIIELLKSDAPVFIKNVADPKNPRVLVVTSTQDRKSGFNIPRTSIPFDITKHMAASELVNNDNFWELANKGVIKFVTEEDAAKVVNDPEIAESLRMAMDEANNTQRVRDLYNASSRTPEADPQDDIFMEALEGQGYDPAILSALKAMKTMKSAAPVSAPEKVSDRVLELEGGLSRKTMSEEEAKHTLKLLLGNLGAVDFKYIMTNPSFPEGIQSWARSRLNAL